MPQGGGWEPQQANPPLDPTTPQGGGKEGTTTPHHKGEGGRGKGEGGRGKGGGGGLASGKSLSLGIGFKLGMPSQNHKTGPEERHISKSSAAHRILSI